jgi:hypothetical protein
MSDTIEVILGGPTRRSTHRVAVMRTCGHLALFGVVTGVAVVTGVTPPAMFRAVASGGLATNDHPILTAGCSVATGLPVSAVCDLTDPKCPSRLKAWLLGGTVGSGLVGCAPAP